MLTSFRILIGRALRESGQALDRLGSAHTRDVAYTERYSRHRKLLPLDELCPSHGLSFIAPNSSIIGEVKLGNDCAVWYGSVLRGDHGAIRIENHVFIGENSTLLTVTTLPQGVPSSITIASNVVIGEHCTLYSCVIDRGVRVGTGAIIQGGAKLETYCVVLPGSVVSPGFTVPAFTVYGGSPAKFVREVSEEDIKKTEEALKTQAEQATRNSEILNALGH